MFGFWVSGDLEGLYASAGNVRHYEDEGKYFIYFLAQNPEDEKIMWDSFIQWITALPEEYDVYHYAHYEKTRIKKLAEKYGNPAVLQKFKNKLIDLQPIIENSIVFPIYFYSIKDIAKYLNFKWRHEKAGGCQSIFWYEQWLETADKNVLQDIIDYNEDDVRAIECVLLWLQHQD